MKNAFMISLLIITLLSPAAAFGADTLHREGKKEIANHPETKNSNGKIYDQNAKTMYSENDAIAFVYSWFAGFDHQADIKFFIDHIDAEKVDMHFPDFPIASIADFTRWYAGVIENIQWNSHHLTNMNVSGDEKNGFSISFDVNWKAKTYKGENFDMNVHQDWKVIVDKNGKFIVSKHRVSMIDKK